MSCRIRTILSPLRRAALALLLVGLSACGQGEPEEPTPKGGGPVVFILEVPASAFSSKGEIRVSVWDSTQIKLSMSNEGCVASIDASGKEETTCPPGVTYQKPSPEVFTFSHADLARPLTIPSKSVTVGEPYRVFIGGKASDDCNSVSARVDNVALEETVSIKDLALAQTEMACLPPQ